MFEPDCAFLEKNFVLFWHVLATYYLDLLKRTRENFPVPSHGGIDQWENQETACRPEAETHHLIDLVARGTFQEYLQSKGYPDVVYRACA